MTPNQNRLIVLGLVVLSIGLLILGLFMPVLTIRGVLTREGVTYVAPTLLEKGINDETRGPRCARNSRQRKCGVHTALGNLG